MGDAARVRQILVNLLSNAVKFTHQGEVFVAVDAEAADAETCRVRFAVKDTGIGIAADHLPRLFQSFTQVDSTTTRKYGGTGLGLAISKRLAELMGGGVGGAERARAWLGVHRDTARAPRAAGRAGRLPAAQRAGARGQAAAGGGRQPHQPAHRHAAGAVVGHADFHLPSALEALDRVRHGEPYDVAVLDMSMPGMDGIELAREIRRRRTAEELPIVMLTSLGQRQMLEAGQGAGAGGLPVQAHQGRPAVQHAGWR